MTIILNTTPADVRAINGSDLDDAAIQPFIDAAACILNTVEACIVGKSISQDCLDIAGAYLAAHLMATSGVAVDTGVKKSETFENYKVEFVTGSYDAGGVLNTPYGSNANAILGGCLYYSGRPSFQVCFGG